MRHTPHCFKQVLTQPRLPPSFGRCLFLVVCIMSWAVTYVVAQSPAPAPQYVARVTQVDTSRFPVIRVFVSITDAKGNSIPDSQSVAVVIREDGKDVSRESLSTGYSLSSVLVLDVSGSMSGDKLEKAKEAAINYVDLAQGNHQIAIVTFSDSANTIQPFTTDKAILRARIGGLTAGGKTALQEGVAVALDILRRQVDRKTILVLTDGEENRTFGFYGGAQGQRRLVERALKQECSISTIGLGNEVKADYLRLFEETKGQYVYSPSAAQLAEIFGQKVKQLQKERVFTYTTSNPDPDGTRRSITVALDVNGKVGTGSAPMVVTIPGLLPHVVGNHTPYLILLLVLLAAPSTTGFVRSFYSVYNFRRRHMVHVTPGSAYIGRKDLNDAPDRGFMVGDVLVLCPVSETPHHVQCWRYNKCRCFHDNSERQICYHRALPDGLRRGLDYLFSKRRGKTGRTWLCRCAGDQEGC
jgi:Mg-chelatase subunit ChlD